MTVRPLAAAAALCLLASCDDSALSVVCPGEAAPALLVSVVDTAGARSLAAEARGWYVVGARTDSLRYRAFSSGEGLVAEGPPGSYRVEVLVDGHAPWRQEAVGVRAGACGPETVSLIAIPDPLP
jgi:hypothetical protein